LTTAEKTVHGQEELGNVRACPFAGRRCAWRYFTPWIAMTIAHVSAGPTISARNGITVDFSDFAIAIPLGQTQAGGIFPLNVF
jgi:hypothetical protein